MPEPGHLLVSADYSQIELRILAHIADIGPLKEAFAKDIDIHARHRLADVRRAGGRGRQRPAPLGQDDQLRHRLRHRRLRPGPAAGDPAGAGASYIDSYFEQYPGIRDYMDAAKAEAREKGFVTTLDGRRCYIPEINVKLPSRRPTPSAPRSTPRSRARPPTS